MHRRPHLPRRSVWAVLAVVLAAGCTGSPTSTSSWQSSSDRALGEAISGLGTTRLAVEQEVRNRVPHSYAVTTINDAIESADKEVSSYSLAQPPDRLHRANQVVSQALDDAVSLMVDARVELASPGLDHAEAGSLLKQIDALRQRLDDLDSKVMASPGAVGSG
jgi:hypothetical protein